MKTSATRKMFFAVMLISACRAAQPGGYLSKGNDYYREGDYDKITHYHTVRVSPYWSSKIARVGQIGAQYGGRGNRPAQAFGDTRRRDPGHVLFGPALAAP